MVTRTTKTDTPTTDGGGEHVESLDVIAALGAQLEAPPLAPGAALQAQANDTAQAAEVAGALELLRAAAVPFAPSHVQAAITALWSDAQLEKIAEAVVKLCAVHGWTMGEFFSEYGPYLQLLMAVGLPTLATIKLLKMPAPKPAEVAGGQQQ